MAQVDSNIALSIRPAQVESPLTFAARAAELQGAQQTQLMNMLKMKEYGDESRVKNAMMKWLSDKPDLDDDTNLNTLATQFGTQGLALAKQIDERRKARGEADYRTAQITDLKSQGTTRNYNLGRSQNEDAIKTISGFTNRQQAIDLLYESEANGTIPRAAAENIRRTIPDNEEEFPAFKQNLIDRLASPDKRAELNYKDEERERKANDDAYIAYVYMARSKNPDAPVLSKDAFIRQRASGVPAAAPVTENALPSNETPAMSPANAMVSRPIFAPTPASASAPVVKETPLVDPTVEATLIARGDFAELAKIRQKASEEREKQNRPVFSEVNLSDRVAVVKRDPVTGKTTIIESFPVGISATDKQKFINDSIKIKQEDRKIALDARRVNLQAKRDSLEAQKAARDADPAYQQRMAAARAAGEATAKDEVKAKQLLPSLISRGQESIRLIDELVGKEPVIDKKTGEVIEEGTKPHPGFETAVGATWQPGARFIDGSPASDFARRDQQLKGASFLEAFEMLKGGGSITNIEGEKGTAAINRMSIAQSEKEYIAAAREVQGILRTGMERARKRANAGASSNPVYDAADAVLRR